MSFSANVKDELCHIENKSKESRRAECYGLWLFSKCFSLREQTAVTENGALARRMLELAAQTAGVSGELRFGVSRRKKPAFLVSLPDEGDRARLLESFGHSGKEPSLRINWAVLEEEESRRAFLRGAFLCCGGVSDPQREYRLEFAVAHQNLAKSLQTLLGEIEAVRAAPSLSSRKSGGYLLFWKDAGQIEDLLTFFGAPRASMELMQVRMYKEKRNSINRRANFETANMDKTMSAAARQIAAIAALVDAGEMERLSEELRQLAELRLQYPDMSLRELGERLGISRSGVNHRLSRLLELGEGYLDQAKKEMS